MYFDATKCSDSITWDQFIEIIYYLQSKHKKKVFGSIDFSDIQTSSPITPHEQNYILRLFKDNDIKVHDAYVETEVDEYGDTYVTMFVEAVSDDYRELQLLESDLYALEHKFEIMFHSRMNGYGGSGRTYEFYHYFM
mgnify:CR=1 FL=1